MSLNQVAISTITDQIRNISSTLYQDLCNFLPTLKETKQLDSKNLTLLNILHIFPYTIISLIFPFIIRYFLVGNSGIDSLDSFSNGFIRMSGAFSFGLLLMLFNHRKYIDFAENNQQASSSPTFSGERKSIFLMMTFYFAYLLISSVINLLFNFGFFKLLFSILKICWYFVMMFHNATQSSILTSKKEN